MGRRLACDLCSVMFARAPELGLGLCLPLPLFL